MPDTCNHWKPEEVDRLRIMVAEGVLPSIIGIRLGKTKNAIIGKCDRMGLLLAQHKPGKSEIMTAAERKERHNARQRRYNARRTGRVTVSPPRSKRALRPAVASPKGISFAELSSEHCRYILNDDTASPVYCGAGQEVGQPYCGAHCGSCFAGYRRGSPPPARFHVVGPVWR